MARADKATTKPQKGDLDRDATRRQQPGAQGAGKEADALDEAGNVDESKLQKNQERLNVDSDHKTPTMRKQRRGSFP
jgi:hypothetical protein